MPAPQPQDTRRSAPRAPDGAADPDDPVALAVAALDGDDPPPDLRALGRRVGMSPWHLHRTFRAATGLTPRQYLDARRLGTARDLLPRAPSVLDAAHDAGYGSARAFYERAGALGMPAADLRDGARDHLLGYTTLDTPVGRAVVVSSTRGVVALRLGPDDDALLDEVRADLPGAELVRDDEGLADLADAVALWFDGDDGLEVVPLDVRATAFQLRVYEELRRIPRGETRTYAQVAEALGMPTGYRAVARACATNAVGLTVPCHRVVRSDGSLAGYRWGLRTKAALLELEGAEVPA
jgi:AraC family transcriptional regulator of adaptative response/methylated-DNA-[protein]-cysteine methyltransferase